MEKAAGTLATQSTCRAHLPMITCPAAKRGQRAKDSRCSVQSLPLLAFRKRSRRSTTSQLLTSCVQRLSTLQAKAAELALPSKCNSEFLANIYHELRTPLNSIIILSQQLAENPSGMLSNKQIEFCRNVNSSGSELLHLINDILDLSNIESGTVTLEIQQIPFHSLRDNIDRTFRHVAEAKNLLFNVEFGDGLPSVIENDPKRLQQILKNLLSNAFNFTA
jgi:signal transduction histidine kinase